MKNQSIQEKIGEFYAHRAAGGYCHYCNSGSNAAPGIEFGKNNSQDLQLCVQYA